MKKFVMCATALCSLMVASAASAAPFPNVAASNSIGASDVTPVTFWKRSRHHGGGEASGFYGQSDTYDSTGAPDVVDPYGSGFYGEADSSGFVDTPSVVDPYDSRLDGDAAPYAFFPDSARSRRMWGDNGYNRGRAPGGGVIIGE